MSVNYQIIELDSHDQELVTQTANLLVIGFDVSWPDMQSALEEVNECLQGDNINRVAMTHDRKIIGWIGGQSNYDGRVWELHPLVIHPDYQKQGLGAVLVQELESFVQQKGGLTIYLGTDDESDQTSISNVDVYPNVLDHLKEIKNIANHPFEFYQKVGFSIVGIVPDANGFGKHDIMMAKRVGSNPT